jgi:hypothetical protein
MTWHAKGVPDTERKRKFVIWAKIRRIGALIEFGIGQMMTGKWSVDSRTVVAAGRE